MDARQDTRVAKNLDILITWLQKRLDEKFPPPIWLSGQVHGYRQYKTIDCFDLDVDSKSLRCVIDRDTRSQCGTLLQPEAETEVGGRLIVSPKDGHFELHIQHVRAVSNQVPSVAAFNGSVKAWFASGVKDTRFQLRGVVSGYKASPKRYSTFTLGDEDTASTASSGSLNEASSRPF